MGVLTAQTISFKKIPNGFSDIATGLGLDASKTAFDTNWAVDDEGMGGLSELGGLEAYQDAALLVRGDVTGLTLKLPGGEPYKDYLRSFWDLGHLMEVTEKSPVTSEIRFPRDCVSLQAAEQSRSNPTLGDMFHSHTYVPCLATDGVESAITETAHGKLLLSAADTRRFNSKSRVFEEAASARYEVAPFRTAMTPVELAPQMEMLRRDAVNLGLNPDETKYWVKFDNLLGGDGVKPYQPQQMRFSDIESWVKEIVESSGMEKTGYQPIVMDIDIGHLPHVKAIKGNVNVQAVVGHNDVMITGVTMQRTENGVYLGGLIPSTDQEIALGGDAHEAAMKVLRAAHQEGYRGYAGIDVIIAEGHDGQTIPFILEMNGRLNSSTTLLSMHQFAEQQAGHRVQAMNANIEFAALPDFSAFADRMNGCLYRGAESGFTGFAPINFITSREGLTGGKMVAIAPDQVSMDDLMEKCRSLEGLELN